MTLQQLEYIVALDNLKNFVKAAEHWYVTQPTLTMQVKKLEDEVGFQIFNRHTKPLKTTCLGEEFVLHAHKVIRETNMLKAIVSDEKDKLDGAYKLGIIPTLAPYILPILLPELAKKHPKIALTIEEQQSETLITGLKNGTIDMGILATPLGENSLREVNVFYEPFLVYFNNDHNLASHKFISPSDLKVEEILLLSEGHCFRNQTLNICQQSIGQQKKQFVYQSGSIETIKALVNKGLGYTLVPELSVLNERKTNKSIKRFEAPEPVREVSLVVHESFYKEKLLDVIRKIIMNNIPETFRTSDRFVRIKWR